MLVMEDSIKKAYLLGLGAAALAVETTDKLVKDLVKKGKLDSTEGKTLVKKVLAESRKESARLQKILDQKIKRTMTRLDVVTRKELKDLEAELNRLSKKVGIKTAKKKKAVKKKRTVKKKATKRKPAKRRKKR